MNYFKDNSLNYNDIPLYFRTNNFLENYNRYIKENLGNKKIINWINFMNFIKSKNDRSIEKLLKNANINYKYKERL